MNWKRVLITGLVVFVVCPIPHSLALKWFLSGLVMSMILGIVASLVYRKE